MSLTLLIVAPLLAAILVAAAQPSRARHIAMAGTLLPVLWFIYVADFHFLWETGEADQLEFAVEWFPALGLRFSLAADTISMLLVGLTVLLGPICVACSYTAITERVKTYYAWLLVLQGAMTGVFLARDVIVFYIFFEFTLVPLYILINLYGSTNRKAAATKFFLFTFTGSIITLAGLLYVAYVAAQTAGGWTFEMSILAGAAQSLPAREQAWVFWALMLGFAVKVPLFPVHTWLPLAHTEAPTAGSVILAGVLLKLGTYGMYRFALGFTPLAAIQYAPAVATLAIIGILYAGLCCWVQTDFKRLIAFSSVSHLGFCVLGLFAFNSIGITGSVLYMLNHGLSTGALFLMVGMVYERYHTRSMKELGGLAAKMPIWATFMVFFSLASVGLPGLNGFVSEFMCLLGAFQSGPTWGRFETTAGLAGELGPWYAFAAGIGMIITAIYILYMVGRVVWGKLVLPHGHEHHGEEKGDEVGGAGEPEGLPTDLNRREIATLLPLAALCLLLGLYPKPLLEVLERPSALLRDTIASARQQPPAPPPPAAPTDADHADTEHGGGPEGGAP
jgi:NADH-quinone oxidoreductase subunit M